MTTPPSPSSEPELELLKRSREVKAPDEPSEDSDPRLRYFGFVVGDNTWDVLEVLGAAPRLWVTVFGSGSSKLQERAVGFLVVIVFYLQ